MSFEETRHQVDSTVADLARAAADVHKWSRKQQSDFDTSRLTPLKAVGTKLSAALKEADEARQAVERLLSE